MLTAIIDDNITLFIFVSSLLVVTEKAYSRFIRVSVVSVSFSIESIVSLGGYTTSFTL